MKKIKQLHVMAGEDDQRAKFEPSSRYVMSVLNSKNGKGDMARFQEALDNINSTLMVLALFFFRQYLGRCVIRELVADAIQEWHVKMLVHGYRNYLANGNGRPFRPYASRILHNICVDQCRRRGRETTGVALEEQRDNRNAPLHDLEILDARARVRDLLRCLPDHQRECLRLTYWEGLSCNEVAERLDTQAQTVATWNWRSRRQLASKLKESDLRNSDV